MGAGRIVANPLAWDDEKQCWVEQVPPKAKRPLAMPQGFDAFVVNSHVRVDANEHRFVTPSGRRLTTIGIALEARNRFAPSRSDRVAYKLTLQALAAAGLGISNGTPRPKTQVGTGHGLPERTEWE